MGILGKVSGLLPGKKNGGYYLQLDESGEVVAPESNIKAAAAPAKVEAAAPAKVEDAAPAKVEAKGNGKTSKKTSVKDSKKAKKEEAVAAAPAPVAAAKKPEPPAETNFATKYLISTDSMARRRPGANMGAFMDMATQVKTPTN
jgi:hypothetical protein